MINVLDAGRNAVRLKVSGNQWLSLILPLVNVTVLPCSHPAMHLESVSCLIAKRRHDKVCLAGSWEGQNRLEGKGRQCHSGLGGM